VEAELEELLMRLQGRPEFPSWHTQVSISVPSLHSFLPSPELVAEHKSTGL
jgi:hypothetical protein